MTAQSPNAYVASLLVHGVIAGAIFLAAYMFRSEQVNTKIMELVAGEGDNYGATEAPALGTPDGAAGESGVQAAPIEAAPPQVMEAIAAPSTAASPVKPAQKVPDFSRQLERQMKKFDAARERAEAKQAAKLEAARARAEAAAAKAEAAAKARADAEAARAKEDVKANRMTKEEFDRKFGSKATSSSSRRSNSGSVKIAKIDGKGIARGVVGGSTANDKGGAGGTALSREEGDMLDAYFSLLVQRLKQEHERPAGVSDLLTARAEFYIASDGTISRVKVIRSSGSPEFDQSVLSAFRNVGSIGPRPDDGGTLRREVTFKMRDD